MTTPDSPGHEKRNVKRMQVGFAHVKRGHGLRLAAYLFVCLVGVLGFWKLQKTVRLAVANQERIEVVRREADRNLCEGINNSRQVLRDLIERSATGAKPPAGASAELVEAYRLAAERGREFRDYALDLLPIESCAAVVDP